MNLSIPTQETATFVHESLGSVPQRILDVGCGDGSLCLLLQEAGHRVIGVDADHASAACATARGIDCRECNWLSFVDAGKYDAVIFNRSLHHLNPLDDALDRARNFLAGGGAILVEDFAYADTDAATIDWFRDLVARTVRSAGLDADRLPACFATDVLHRGSQVWQHDHAAELHTAAAMRNALGARFESVSIEAVPYLYRYLGSVVAEAPDADKLVDDALQQEKMAAAAGRIRLIGRRFVARHTP